MARQKSQSNASFRIKALQSLLTNRRRFGNFGFSEGVGHEVVSFEDEILEPLEAVRSDASGTTNKAMSCDGEVAGPR